MVRGNRIPAVIRILHIVSRIAQEAGEAFSIGQIVLNNEDTLRIESGQDGHGLGRVGSSGALSRERRRARSASLLVVSVLGAAGGAVGVGADLTICVAADWGGSGG